MPWGLFGGKIHPCPPTWGGPAAKLLPAWASLRLLGPWGGGRELRQLLRVGAPWRPGAVPAGAGRQG